MKQLILLIPCHNEEQGIALVLGAIPTQKLRSQGIATTVMVIDNNSTDQTAAIAKKHGARVVHERRQGKGYAMKKGFSVIPANADYVVMIDGDNSYKPAELPRMLEPLESGFCDVVVGSRLAGKMRKTSMSLTSRIGNWLFTFLVRLGAHENLTDALSGFFAWKAPVIRKLAPHLHATGFSIEMEMIVKTSKLKYEMCSVPITYEVRACESKLRPFRDGLRVLRTYFRSMRWRA